MLIPFLLVFGVSLFSVWYPWDSYLPFTLAASDITVGLASIYAAVRVGRLTLNPTVYATGFLVFSVLLGAAINDATDSSFDMPSFGINFVRGVALVIMVLLLQCLL